VYGEHFVTEPRATEGRPERFPSLAAELARPRVDVIVSGLGLPALKLATSTIPIVTTAAIDPVGSGYVRSLGRPGGNFTGAEPSGNRHNGEATRTPEGARPVGGAGGRPLEQRESE
jgi:putative ABC transport system substrate-binding protein